MPTRNGMPTPAIHEARHRHRVGNIFTAALMDATSYSDAELWTLIEGVSVAGKPTSEYIKVQHAAMEYDAAINALVHGRPPRFLGEQLTAFGETPVDAAVSAAERSTEFHTVVNVMNVGFVMQGAPAVQFNRDYATRLRPYVEAAMAGDGTSLRSVLSSWKPRFEQAYVQAELHE